MNLDTFTPPVHEDGDRLPAKEMAGRPLVVVVREHRTGVKTTFNSNPADPARYKPEGGEAVSLDVADLTTGSVYIGVLWFNGAIVDSLKGYVGSTLPIKLVFTAGKTGGNPYLMPEPLAGPELASAQGWAAANPQRFDTERAARQAQAAQTAAAGIPPIPGAPTAPPAWVPQAAATPTVTAPPSPTPAAAPAATFDPNDPAVQALLAQIAQGQLPSA